ncbi:MAG: FAD-dependent oxidoreductase, partial [Ignavibacteriaceae bacterium]
MTNNSNSQNLSSGGQADLLVIGAGIAGITSAVEAAETGMNVILVEKNPYIGGKVAGFNQYFPKLCPPGCGLEINIRRLRTNPLVKLFTMAEVTDVQTESGVYKVNIRLQPRFVNN